MSSVEITCFTLTLGGTDTDQETRKCEQRPPYHLPATTEYRRLSKVVIFTLGWYPFGIFQGHIPT